MFLKEHCCCYKNENDNQTSQGHNQEENTGNACCSCWAIDKVAITLTDTELGKALMLFS